MVYNRICQNNFILTNFAPIKCSDYFIPVIFYYFFGVETVAFAKKMTTTMANARYRFGRVSETLTGYRLNDG